MKIKNQPENPLTDDACKKATGKTIKDWYKQFDKDKALENGRRNTVRDIYAQTNEAWWSTTLYVEYEKSKGLVKKDGLAEGYSICATKTIKAPVEKVYQAWTDAKTFAQFFGDDGKQDVKDGGMITCKAGTKATFTRVRPNKDLRFTWEHKGCTAPVQIDVTFQDNKGKTLMNVMPSRIQTRDEADGLREAWGEALDKLKAICEV